MTSTLVASMPDAREEVECRVEERTAIAATTRLLRLRLDPFVDHRQFDALTHGFAGFAHFGGGSADATTATISAIRAHLSRG